MSFLGVDPRNPNEFKSHAETMSPDHDLDASVVSGGWNPPLTRAESHLMRQGGWTREQIQMRREKGDFSTDKPREPEKLGDVLDDLISVPSSDVEVTQEAWNIINEHGEGLVLGFKEWAIVQKLVEAGIVSGRAGS